MLMLELQASLNHDICFRHTIQKDVKLHNNKNGKVEINHIFLIKFAEIKETFQALENQRKDHCHK